MFYTISGYFSKYSIEYDISWTMPQCILCLRLIGHAFDVFDGTLPEVSNLTFPQCMAQFQVSFMKKSSRSTRYFFYLNHSGGQKQLPEVECFGFGAFPTGDSQPRLFPLQLHSWSAALDLKIPSVYHPEHQQWGHDGFTYFWLPKIGSRIDVRSCQPLCIYLGKQNRQNINYLRYLNACLLKLSRSKNIFKQYIVI